LSSSIVTRGLGGGPLVSRGYAGSALLPATGSIVTCGFGTAWLVTQGYQVGILLPATGSIVTCGFGTAWLVTQDYRLGIAAADLKQAIVAALGDLNLYPDVIPQTNVGPAVAFWFTTSSHGTSLTAAGGIRRTTVQFEIQAQTTAQIEAVSEVIRNRVQGLRRALAGLPISFVAYETEADGYYEPLPGSDLGTHWKQVDYVFVHRESAPTLS
jgi:hypothetical protein